MQLLLKSDNVIELIADHIIFGEYEGEQKWALYDENNHIFLYALDDNYHVETYSGILPEDIYIECKYIYDNGAIVQNPDWHPSEEQDIQSQVAELQATIDDLLTNVLPMLMGEI